MILEIFPHEIEYYKTEDGTAPFKEWLAALRDVSGRAKIRIRLDRARMGNFGDHKLIDEGIWELRVDYGPGYRVYFAKEGHRLILLLIGGAKNSQKKDIAQASSYLQDHRRRHRHGAGDRVSKGFNRGT